MSVQPNVEFSSVTACMPIVLILFRFVCLGIVALIEVHVSDRDDNIVEDICCAMHFIAQCFCSIFRQRQSKQRVSNDQVIHKDGSSSYESKWQN